MGLFRHPKDNGIRYHYDDVLPFSKYIFITILFSLLLLIFFTMSGLVKNTGMSVWLPLTLPYVIGLCIALYATFRAIELWLSGKTIDDDTYKNTVKMFPIYNLILHAISIWCLVFECIYMFYYKVNIIVEWQPIVYLVIVIVVSYISKVFHDKERWYK